MISEGLHEDLKKIFHAFDQYAKDNDIAYDISVDEGGYQSYFVPKDHKDKMPALEDMMDIEAAKHNVHFQVDKNKRGAQFIFSIAALNEKEDMQEDQYKSPTRKMINKQSMFRSSFGPSRTFGGVSGYGRRKKFRKKLSEALARLDGDKDANASR